MVGRVLMGICVSQSSITARILATIFGSELVYTTCEVIQVHDGQDRLKVVVGGSKCECVVGARFQTQLPSTRARYD